MIRRTEIDWISTDDKLPEPGAHIIALAPLMGVFGGKDELMLIEAKVLPDGYALMSLDDHLEELPWETGSLMWWAPCPNWMERPGWLKS